MKLATIISALRAYCPSFERRVGGAAEYAARVRKILWVTLR